VCKNPQNMASILAQSLVGLFKVLKKVMGGTLKT
jgi:hypothetical protein